MPIPVTGLAAAIAGLLLLLLALRVSQLRLRHKVSLGDKGIPELTRAIRVHGNTVEHVPVFLVQSACYELAAGASPLLIGSVVLFLLARLLFAWGLSRSSLSLARRAGAGLTYLAELVLSVALLVQVVSMLCG